MKTNKKPITLLAVILAWLFTMDSAMAQSGKSTSGTAATTSEKSSTPEKKQAVSPSQATAVPITPTEAKRAETRKAQSEMEAMREEYARTKQQLDQAVASKSISQAEINKLRQKLDDLQVQMTELATMQSAVSAKEEADQANYWQNQLASFKASGNPDLDKYKKDLILAHIQAEKLAASGSMSETQARAFKTQIIELENKIKQLEK